MANYEAKDLRNIVLCGHGGAGKTMLAEAMLLKAGEIKRLGSVTDGSTVSDFEPEEKKHQYSIRSSVLRCPYQKTEFNIIDTPGGLDFFGGQVGGLGGGDIAALCINAQNGIEVNTRKAWRLADDMGKAHMIIITRIDGDNVNYEERLNEVKELFGSKCVSFTIPVGEGAELKSVFSVFGDKVPEDQADRAAKCRQDITENVVESDDKLMEKYLESGEISDEEFIAALPKAIVKGCIIPIFAVAAEKDMGVAEFMEALVKYAPSPLCLDVKVIKGEGEEAEETTIKPDGSGPLLGRVFKTISDPHMGKLSFVRIYSGTLPAKGSFTITRTGETEKAAHIYRHNAEKHEEVSEGHEGNIITLGKIDALTTGDVITDGKTDLTLPVIPFPTPMIGVAISPKARGDEQKLGSAIHRISDEDPAIHADRDPQTHELVMRGLGQIHLDVTLERMKSRYNVEVTTKQPKIPYLETISAKGEGHYKHKKQSGGAGQFAEVYLRVSPNERGEGYEFVNSVVGGAISQSFVGSTEKGVVQALEKGPLGGFPVVDIVVDVHDGKEHPVDSKDIAFQTAGRNAFYDAMEKAKPVLLEPIVNLEVHFPTDYTGDINGDISGRRGRPTGMEMMGGMQMLTAEVPLAEVSDYGSALKAITQGEGFFSMELARYDPMPSNVAQQIVAKLKAQAEADEE